MHCTKPVCTLVLQHACRTQSTAQTTLTNSHMTCHHAASRPLPVLAVAPDASLHSDLQASAAAATLPATKMPATATMWAAQLAMLGGAWPLLDPLLALGALGAPAARVPLAPLVPLGTRGARVPLAPLGTVAALAPMAALAPIGTAAALVPLAPLTPIGALAALMPPAPLATLGTLAGLVPSVLLGALLGTLLTSL